MLQDLAQDNQNAIKKDKGFSLPGLSFWGVSVVTPSDWFSSGEGRFGVEFNTAVRTIQGMTESQFERPTVKQTTAKQEETKPSDVKKQRQQTRRMKNIHLKILIHCKLLSMGVF